jgi:hypothetical protein
LPFSCKPAAKSAARFYTGVSAAAGGDFTTNFDATIPLLSKRSGQ